MAMAEDVATATAMEKATESLIAWHAALETKLILGGVMATATAMAKVTVQSSDLNPRKCTNACQFP